MGLLQRIMFSGIIAFECACKFKADLRCRLCIIAGDISPVDVITPLPVLCEDNDIPYIYVPSKEVWSSPCWIKHK